MVGYHKSSAPLSLYPLRLEINVALTPFVFPQLNLHEFTYIGFVVFEFALRFQALSR